MEELEYKLQGSASIVAALTQSFGKERKTDGVSRGKSSVLKRHQM